MRPASEGRAQGGAFSYGRPPDLPRTHLIRNVSLHFLQVGVALLLPECCIATFTMHRADLQGLPKNRNKFQINQSADVEAQDLPLLYRFQFTTTT